MQSSTKQLAREAESNPVLKGFARGGYAANGVVHILIGVIALVIAFGGDGESDQTGALMAIAKAPFGFLVLWVLAIGLWALGLWNVLAGVLVRAPSQGGSGKTDSTTDKAKQQGSKWGQRVSHWGQAVVFIAIGLVAASVALGARADSEQSTENASRGVLSIPGGPFVLGAVGLGIGIGGVAFVVMGVMRSFEKKMTIPSNGIGPAVKGLGIVGYIAKGIALAIVGILLIVAAIRVDPDEAGGLDAAIAALIALPYGPWLAGGVGAGLIAYGVFLLFRARYAEL